MDLFLTFIKSLTSIEKDDIRKIMLICFVWIYQEWFHQGENASGEWILLEGLGLGVLNICFQFCTLLPKHALHFWTLVQSCIFDLNWNLWFTKLSILLSSYFYHFMRSSKMSGVHKVTPLHHVSSVFSHSDEQVLFTLMQTRLACKLRAAS